MSPLIFVHGAGTDHTVWRYQTRRFRRLGYEVIAPDLPGHGTNPDPGASSVGEYAAWLADHLADRPPVVLVGHSMGALVAMELAASFDRIVVRLVLVGASMRMAVHPDLAEAARVDVSVASDLIAGWSLPASFRGGHPEPGTWQRGAGQQLTARSAPGVLAGDLDACVAFDGGEIAAGLALPTLVINGGEDRMNPAASARRLAETIPDAGFMVLSGCGHDPMIQQPRRFNQVLEGWLSDGGKLQSH